MAVEGARIIVPAVGVAFDRALKSAECFGLEGPLDRWRALCAEIHEDVCRNGFNAELGSFVQCYGTRDLDSSLLDLCAFSSARH